MRLSRLSWIASYYFHTLLNATVIDRRKLYAVWEQSQLEKLFAYLDVDCVFDVGANEGQYAEMLRQAVARHRSFPSEAVALEFVSEVLRRVDREFGLAGPPVGGGGRPVLRGGVGAASPARH